MGIEVDTWLISQVSHQIMKDPIEIGMKKKINVV